METIKFENAYNENKCNRYFEEGRGVWKSCSAEPNVFSKNAIFLCRGTMKSLKLKILNISHIICVWEGSHCIIKYLTVLCDFWYHIESLFKS